jgi:septum formation protein
MKRVLPGSKVFIMDSGVKEKRRKGESVETFCMRVARDKADRAWDGYKDRSISVGAVIGADTVIYFKGQIIGQPKDSEDAVRILKRLSGQCHEVVTGVAVFCVSSRRFKTFIVRSSVWMRKLDLKTIKDYVATGEPLGKAGAYAIQGKGRKLMARYEGSYSNIVGLPVEELRRVLKCLH